MEPSKDQKRVYREIQNTNNNIIISAVAGSGKTTTIVEGVNYIPRGKSTLFLAFNNSIVNELKNRLPDHVYVSTLHSFGFKCCIRAYGNITVNDAKIFKIAEDLGRVQKWFKKGEEEDKKLGDYCFQMKEAANFVRFNLAETILEYNKILEEHGMLFTGEDLLRLKNVVELSNKRIGQFDFTDMIYQPTIRSIRLPKFDYVIVDELQDLNIAQQNLIGKLVKPGTGRFIGVGDPAQSIYYFAGADANSYDRMKTFFPKTVELPLSVCYRCGKEIVKYAQEVNPVIQPWDSQEAGKVSFEGKVSMLKEGDWVLCRNTKPLIVLFLELMKDNKKAYVKGREVGDNLIRLIKRQGKRLSVEELYKCLDSELLKLRVKLLRRKVRKPDTHPSMDTLREKVEVIKILGDGCQTSTGLIKKIEIIFTETVKAIVLSTIHKAKGLENERIFVICPELIPSRFAITPMQLRQEYNLDYVMRTRAKKSLIYIKDFTI